MTDAADGAKRVAKHVKENGVMKTAQAAPRHLKKRIRNAVRYYGRPLANTVYKLTDAKRITDPDDVYRSSYYEKRTRGVHTADAECFTRAVASEFDPDSVIDLGCAVGHYLRPFHADGVDFHGVDGHPAALEHSVIPTSRMELADLRDGYHPPKEYDVAMCIEVAEHLAPQYAQTFVDSVTRCAPVVIFTAAPPGQGGTHHVNEQPREYWMALFRERGYEYDGDAVRRIRGQFNPTELTHVNENLFVFRERTQ